MKQCPQCSERLKPDAIVCTHCGHQFAPIPPAPGSGFTPTPNAQKIGCGLLVLAALALMLWAFSTRYQAESPPAANAMKEQVSG
jgi:hypothetical protein